MFSVDEIATILRLAEDNKIEPAALCAVIAIESGGKTTTLINGTPKPLIRFEGHYFDRRLKGAQKTRARNQKLAHPKAGYVKNPTSQALRYQRLAQAQRINRQAAIESTSWGLGQVMGAHWNWLGYASADALMKEALSGFDGQLRLMLRFIVKSNLRPKIQARDWKGFARIYNGSNYRKNRYDTKLARFYARFKKDKRLLDTAPINTPPMNTVSKATLDESKKPQSPRILALGCIGEDVKTLQMMLTSKGYYCVQDGIFGKNTRTVLIKFQTAQKLNPSGVLDHGTQKALKIRKKPKPSGFFTQFFKNIGEKLRFGALNSTQE